MKLNEGVYSRVKFTILRIYNPTQLVRAI